jgi:prolyl-tRNA synthetase
LITDRENYFCICVRGDHEINFVKLKKLLAVEKELTMASEKEVLNIMGCPIGSVGPMIKECPVYVDNDAFNCVDFICGANREGFHLQNANWDRKQIKKIADIRNAVDGDLSPDGNGVLKIKKGIEVGHIFKLGTKYSNSMKAFVTDSNGDSIPMIMGCYGIGISRIVAAAIEQNHDENGIIWPPPLAPFLCAVVPINPKKSQLVNEHAEKIYQQLSELDIEVILCDQNKRPGVLFSDLDLIGIPIRIVLSEKNIENGKMEIKVRKNNEIILWDVNDIQSFIKKFQSGEMG